MTRITWLRAAALLFTALLFAGTIAAPAAAQTGNVQLQITINNTGSAPQQFTIWVNESPLAPVLTPPGVHLYVRNVPEAPMYIVVLEYVCCGDVWYVPATPQEEPHHFYVEAGCAPCPPPPSCLLAGTPITMADGSTRPIESLSIGDRVLAYDPATRTTAVAPIATTFVHTSAQMSGSYLVINRTLRVTSNHPLYLNGTWKDAGQARVGDRMLGVSGVATPITTIETVNQSVPTFNLEVAGLHTYFAAGVLVHNKPDPPPYRAEGADGD